MTALLQTTPRNAAQIQAPYEGLLTVASFYTDTLRFNYATRGSGTTTFFFQHGLGGTLAQPFRFLIRPEGENPDGAKGQKCHARNFRLAAFDFRAHGATPLGASEKLRVDVFADDLVAFLDHLQVLGDISKGAAVALIATLRYPKRCIALVLSQPAWLDGSMSATATAAYQEAVTC